MLTTWIDEGDYGEGYEEEDDGLRSPNDINEEEDDDDLPIFASRKNKELNAKVKRKEKMVEEVERKNEELVERSKIMAEHLKNVKQVSNYLSFTSLDYEWTYPIELTRMLNVCNLGTNSHSELSRCQGKRN
jgi:hypothetical protein